MREIAAAIESIEAARVAWAKVDKVHAKLGKALQQMRIAEKKAKKAIADYARNNP